MAASPFIHTPQGRCRRTHITEVMECCMPEGDEVTSFRGFQRLTGRVNCAMTATRCRCARFRIAYLLRGVNRGRRWIVTRNPGCNPALLLAYIKRRR